MGKDDESAKVLLFDIETTPNLSWTCGTWQTDAIRVERDWRILCFGYKWLGGGPTKVVSQPQFREAYRNDPNDDFHVVHKLHDLLSTADVVVAHNGNEFDLRRANARFIFHGLGPPEPYKSVDTLKVARRHFKFNSNRLGDLGEHLGLGGKAETGGFDTWLGCMSGNRSSWRQMTTYCAQDVDLLESVYLTLRPWITTHPHVGLLSGDLAACSKCGSSKLTKRGFQRGPTMTRQRYQCVDCGGWCVGRLAEKADKPLVVNAT